MSVNMYLAPEVMDTELYKRPGGELPGMIRTSKGRLFFEMALEDKVPGLLEPFLEEFSVREYTPVHAFREAGVYIHESARAEINHVTWTVVKDNQRMHRIHMTAKKMEDARELIHLFEIGKIRPAESYHTPQGGKSRAELETQALVLEAQVQGLKAQVKGLKESIADASLSLLALLESLDKSWMGVCPVTKPMIWIKRVREILAA